MEESSLLDQMVGEREERVEVPIPVVLEVAPEPAPVCSCGEEGLEAYQIKHHYNTTVHKQNMAAKNMVQLEVNGAWDKMDEDFQAAIDTCKTDPLMAAKMVRRAFTSRHWPNRVHPGSVREFMEENGMAIFDAPPNINLTQSEINNIRQAQIEEYVNGQQH